jgi:hypothetical protein
MKLPNIKIHLVPNPIAIRKSYMGKSDHVGRFMFPRTSCRWVVPRYEHGSYFNIFSSYTTDVNEQKELREYLEEQLGLKLSHMTKDSDIKDLSVKVYVDSDEPADIMFEYDLSNPKEFLDYLILKSQEDIAPTWKERDIKGRQYRWVLKEPNEDMAERVNQSKKKAYCYGKLNGMKENKPAMYYTLKLLGKRLTWGWTDVQLFDALSEIIEGRNIDKLYDILYNSEKSKERIFVIQAMDCSEVLLKNGEYFLATTSEKIGNSEQDVIDFFNDLDNITYKQGVTTKIQEYKKQHNM